MADKIITVRVKAFTGDKVREHRCSVDENRTVRVWDVVAGHYTTCHILNERTMRRIRKMARAEFDREMNAALPAIC